MHSLERNSNVLMKKSNECRKEKVYSSFLVHISFYMLIICSWKYMRDIYIDNFGIFYFCEKCFVMGKSPRQGFFLPK